MIRYFPGLLLFQGIALIQGEGYKTLAECNLRRPYVPFHDQKLEDMMTKLFDCEERRLLEAKIQRTGSDHYFTWNRKDNNCGSASVLNSSAAGLAYRKRCEKNNDINFVCFAHDKCYEDNVMPKSKCDEYYCSNLNYLASNDSECTKLAKIACQTLQGLAS